MSDYDNAIFRLATAQEAEPEDYTGEDGLLYCGNCRQPKEAYFTEGKSLFGRDRHPKECDCQRKRREKQEAADREQKHREEVARLKRKGFTNPAMLEWTFENDNGKCPQMDKALFYAANWEEMRAENIGYLLWGKVGTGNPGLTDLFLKQARKVLQAPEKGSVLEKLKQEPPERKPAAPKKREPER